MNTPELTGGGSPCLSTPKSGRNSGGKRIRTAAIENGHIDKDTEDSIKSRLVAALFKFRFDEQEV